LKIWHRICKELVVVVLRGGLVSRLCVFQVICHDKVLVGTLFTESGYTCEIASFLQFWLRHHPSALPETKPGIQFQCGSLHTQTVRSSSSIGKRRATRL